MIKLGNISVILDVGEFSSKIGFGSENEPRQTFYTIIGQPKYQNLEMGVSEKIFYVGNEVANSIGLYKIFRPIEMGKIVDWVLFENILDYIFYQLKVEPAMVNVLYTINPLFTEDDKKKLYQLFFNKYQVNGLYLVLDSLLTMYSGGFQTGLVIEMGAGSTRIIPIYEGFKLDHATQILKVGGSLLDNFMIQQLKNVGYSIDSSVQREIVRVLKEKACFVSLNYDDDINKKNQYKKEYSLPDGQKIELTSERFVVPELIFKPKLFNVEEKPLHDAILDCIELCDLDIRTKLLENIFLSGGGSCFPQLEYRLQQELEVGLVQRGKQMRKPKIIAPRERMFSPWIGGSILSCIPEFQSSWVTRTQYYSSGIPDHQL